MRIQDMKKKSWYDDLKEAFKYLFPRGKEEKNEDK